MKQSKGVANLIEKLRLSLISGSYRASQSKLGRFVIQHISDLPSAYFFIVLRETLKIPVKQRSSKEICGRILGNMPHSAFFGIAFGIFPGGSEEC